MPQDNYVDLGGGGIFAFLNNGAQNELKTTKLISQNCLKDVKNLRNRLPTSTPPPCTPPPPSSPPPPLVGEGGCLEAVLNSA